MPEAERVITITRSVSDTSRDNSPRISVTFYPADLLKSSCESRLLYLNRFKVLKEILDSKETDRSSLFYPDYISTVKNYLEFNGSRN
jgi:hypothetical protein